MASRPGINSSWSTLAEGTLTYLADAADAAESVQAVQFGCATTVSMLLGTCEENLGASSPGCCSAISCRKQGLAGAVGVAVAVAVAVLGPGIDVAIAVLTGVAAVVAVAVVGSGAVVVGADAVLVLLSIVGSALCLGDLECFRHSQDHVNSYHPAEGVVQEHA